MVKFPLLSALNFVVLWFRQESVFQFDLLKSSHSIFLTYFSVAFVQHDCSC